MVHSQAVAGERSSIAGRNVGRKNLPVDTHGIGAEPSASKHSKNVVDCGHGVQLPPRKVLIVGDSPGLCAALARSLCHPALRVLTAESSERGLSLLARETIDFVIAELCLPPSSGIGFLEAVKQEFPETTRVLITGQSGISVIRDAIKRSDVSFFLGKPWDAHSLRELQRNLLLVEWSPDGLDQDGAADLEAECRALSVSENLALDRVEALQSQGLVEKRIGTGSNGSQRTGRRVEVESERSRIESELRSRSRKP